MFQHILFLKKILLGKQLVESQLIIWSEMIQAMTKKHSLENRVRQFHHELISYIKTFF